MTIYEYLKERHSLQLLTDQIEALRRVVLIDSGVCPECKNRKIIKIDGEPISCPSCFI